MKCGRMKTKKKQKENGKEEEKERKEKCEVWKMEERRQEKYENKRI